VRNWDDPRRGGASPSVAAIGYEESRPLLSSAHSAVILLSWGSLLHRRIRFGFVGGACSPNRRQRRPSLTRRPRVSLRTWSLWAGAHSEQDKILEEGGWAAWPRPSMDW